MKNNKNNQRGQALVTLLYIMVIGIAITSAIAVNMLGGGTMQQGEYAYYAAESGIENAILKLLRNPSYDGEIVNLENGGSVTTEITSQNPLTIVATGKYYNTARKI